MAFSHESVGLSEQLVRADAIASVMTNGLAIYFGIGIIFALLFVTFLVSRLDVAAQGASILFRPVIFLGTVVIWPLVVLRVLTFRQINQPIESEGKSS